MLEQILSSESLAAKSTGTETTGNAMRNRPRRPVRRCGSVAAGFFLLSAIAAAKSSAVAAEPIKIGISRTLSDAGYYIADAMGFFRDVGIDVSIMGFNSAAQMIAPLGTGELDVGGGTV